MNILGLLGGDLLSKVGDLAKVFFGSKGERDAAIADEMQAIQNSYMAELNAAEKIGWWARFVEGLNRLVRPFFTFGTVGLFTWCVVDPVAFQTAMVAMSAIPEAMWYLIYAVVGFWFGGRMLEKAPTRMKALNVKEVATLLALQKQMSGLNELPVETEVTPVEPEVAPTVEPKPITPKKRPWEGRAKE
jgi:hypothetical protein